MILLIDNYDSFSYNVYQLVGSVNPDIRVIRNDECSVEEIRAMNPSHIILSPGPGRPDKAGVCEEVIRALGGKIPILGICLGHQTIGEALGGTVTYAKELYHGKQSLIHHTGTGIFDGIESPIRVARYHSLAVSAEDLPDCLDVLATTEDGEIMAMQHKKYPVIGLQFHPESVYTEHGKRMMENFLSL